MRNTLFVTIQMIFLVVFCVGSVFAAGDDETQETVYGLQQVGWTIAEKKVCQDSQLGIAPYQLLPRVLSITTYWLHLDKEEIICKIIYDSQLDRQHERCGEKHPVSEAISPKALKC